MKSKSLPWVYIVEVENTRYQYLIPTLKKDSRCQLVRSGVCDVWCVCVCVFMCVCVCVCVCVSVHGVPSKVTSGRKSDEVFLTESSHRS